MAGSTAEPGAAATATAPRRVHFVGIGGAGMSVIAELLLTQGIDVSGSDRSDSAVLQRLSALGARVYVGHDGHHLQGITERDVVVYSTAIRADNPELLAARAAGAQVWHRSVALAFAARHQDFVAVAGAHGKTTTSAMLAVGLLHAGQDPSFALGGAISALGTGARIGGGPAFVAEADESDSSFLNYSPTIAIVTNVEPDHLDHFGTPEAYHRAFVEFSKRLGDGGLLITNSDDPGAARLAAAAGQAGQRVQTYGVGEHADVHLEVTSLAPGAAGARVTSSLGAVQLDIAVPGEHNLLNATAAWCAGVELGVDPAQMASALTQYTGTSRRFEYRGSAGGVRVFDDYAHNPTKVAAAIATAVRAATGGRVIAVFQPHLFSRTRDFAEQFAQSLAPADVVLLAGIYAAREDPIDGVSARLIAAGLPQAEVIEDHAELARTAAQRAHAGDLIVTIGAGDITALPDVILRQLEDR